LLTLVTVQSNSFDSSLEDASKKLPAGAKRELPSLIMPPTDVEEDAGPYGAGARADQKIVKPNMSLKLPTDEDSIYQGDEVSEDNDTSAVDESIAMDESMASNSSRGHHTVPVSFAVKNLPVSEPAGATSRAIDQLKRAPPAPQVVKPATAGNVNISANLEYSVEFEDDFEEDLNDRYGIDMSQIRENDAVEYEDDSEKEDEMEESAGKPSVPRIMAFSGTEYPPK
jgi:hypothetical protein